MTLTKEEFAWSLPQGSGFRVAACLPDQKDAALNKMGRLETSSVVQAGHRKNLDQVYHLGFSRATGIGCLRNGDAPLLNLGTTKTNQDLYKVAG